LSLLEVSEIVVDLVHDASELDVDVLDVGVVALEGVDDLKAMFEHLVEDDAFVFNDPPVLFPGLHQVIAEVLDADVLVLRDRVDLLQELGDAVDAVVGKRLRWLTAIEAVLDELGGQRRPPMAVLALGALMVWLLLLVIGALEFCIEAT
jgi:hypothetical protein